MRLSSLSRAQAVLTIGTSPLGPEPGCGTEKRSVVIATLLVVALTVSIAWPKPGQAQAGETTIGARLPFDQPSAATLRSSPRKVFAHWHWFPISIENAAPTTDYYATQWLHPGGENGKFAAVGGYLRQRPLGRPLIADTRWRQIDMRREVTRAAAAGIDGFTFNILSSNRSSYEWSKLTTMLDAAEAADPGFKIVPMIDATVIPAADVESVFTSLAAIASRPSLYQLPDGRLAIAAFGAEAWPKAAWQSLVTRLNAAFVPVFVSWAPETAPADSHGLSLWGPRTVPDIAGLTQPAAYAHARGKIWMAPVAPQDFRPKDLVYWEAGNSQLFRTMWEHAITNDAEWVQLITWNDYSEASEVQPSTGTQYGYYDLMAYYITWFKTGVRPRIARDVLYYFHRIEATTATPDLSRQRRIFQSRGGAAATNHIELLAFLTSPGTLEIEIGGKVHQQQAAAGMTSFKIPLAIGTPRFRIYRNGAAAVAFDSAFQIRDRIVFQDLLYRSGSSTRRIVPLVADPPIP
jgi:hypothetical protein